MAHYITMTGMSSLFHLRIPFVSTAPNHRAGNKHTHWETDYFISPLITKRNDADP